MHNEWYLFDKPSLVFFCLLINILNIYVIVLLKLSRLIQFLMYNKYDWFFCIYVNTVAVQWHKSFIAL